MIKNIFYIILFLSTSWANSQMVNGVAISQLKSRLGFTGSPSILGVGNGGTGTSTQFTLGSSIFAGASGVYTQDNDNYFWDNTNKRLGIGVTGPLFPLDVQKTGAVPPLRVLSTTLSGIRMDSDSANAAARNWFAGSNVVVYGDYVVNQSTAVGGSPTAGTTRFYIDPSGNVGIGTAAPSSLVHVQQAVDSVVTATPIGLNVDSVGAAGELTAASSLQTFAQIAPIINQTSTAGYTALKINSTETSTGSGLKLLADLQVGGASKFSVNNFGKIAMDATNTAGGTTGAQTINKPSGTVNFAAAASSLVVTNSLVTTSSIVHAMVRTNDSTAIIKNVVPAAGSFTITLNASATAETSVGFVVFN